ncbi:MAG: helix-turn-helix transcriptional regulator, partial [Xanthomonadales bacterium]|nr:helix-turn-helix transcriptional regulator [Xanthomonadales bacterium]
MTISTDKLIQLRKDRGWSQEKLAAISGISVRTIQRAEKDGTCSLETKLALATVLEISPAE